MQNINTKVSIVGGIKASATPFGKYAVKQYSITRHRGSKTAR